MNFFHFFDMMNAFIFSIHFEQGAWLNGIKAMVATFFGS